MLKWVLPAVAVVLVAIAASAFAQAPAERAAPGSLLQRARQLLNLTDEQVARLERALNAHEERATRLRIELARARLDLREALLAPSPDRARIEAIARRLATLGGDLTLARVNRQLEIRTILTLEQYRRFERLLGTRMKHFWRGRLR